MKTNLKSNFNKNIVAERTLRLAQLRNIEHRLEFVDEFNGVEYINDAKASDINSTWYSIENINRPIIWIVSSTCHENDCSMYDEIPLDNVKAVFVLGSNKEALKNAFTERVARAVSVDSIENAVKLAAKAAQDGDAVLFSPSCDDFETFKNFKDSGQRFRKAVREIRM